VSVPFVFTHLQANSVRSGIIALGEMALDDDKTKQGDVKLDAAAKVEVGALVIIKGWLVKTKRDNLSGLFTSSSQLLT
jgi:hypothetical protein